MLLAPIGNPEPKDCTPLDTPCFCHLCIYKLATAYISHNLQKHKKSHRLASSMEMKSVGFLRAFKISDNTKCQHLVQPALFNVASDAVT